MSGATSYHAGLAAEDIVARHYAKRRQPIAKRRWRGCAGEVDLIAQNGDQVVFIEVKRSRDFATAAHRLRPRQVKRLMAAGAEFAGTQPKGLLTEMRFDLALVNDLGQVDVIENALFAA